MSQVQPFITPVNGSEYGHSYKKGEILELAIGKVEVVSTLLHKLGYERNRAYFIKTVEKLDPPFSGDTPKRVTSFILEQNLYSQIMEHKLAKASDHMTKSNINIDININKILKNSRKEKHVWE